MKKQRRNSHRVGVLVRSCVVMAILALAPTAWGAACRITDFTDRTLSSLNEVQRLSFVSHMTQTEFDRLKEAAPGSENYYSLIVESSSVKEAREKAIEKLETLDIPSVDGYRNIWATDYLTDEQLKRFTNCVSGREPGLTVAGRPESPSRFNLVLTHLTPIGIEKIRTRLVASYNVANVDELEAFLASIGMVDNYPAKLFPLKLIDPSKRAVVVLRAGWETPDIIYIPPYPTPDYFK